MLADFYGEFWRGIFVVEIIMTIWFDTHCHLDRLPAYIDVAESVQRAVVAGVTGIIVPGACGNVDRPAELLRLPGIGLAWGIHPEYPCDESFLQLSLPWESAGYEPVAIGECGLDKRCSTELDQQQKLFRWQLALAKDHGLPLIVHLVGHYKLAWDMMVEAGTVPAQVMHSWSGSAEMAARFVDLGAYISLSASCLKNPDRLRSLFKLVGPERILVETDSPGMKPSFWPGDCNEPAALTQIGSQIASVVEIEVAKLAEILYKNSLKVFGELKTGGNHG